MHHASLIVGSSAEALAHVESLFGSLKASPDYFPWHGETFGIEEARKVSEQALHKAFGAHQVFFIAPFKITLEAQNALLKTFEEPIADTYFFLAVRDEAMIIPTLRSRMQCIRLEGATDGAKDAKKFLSLSIKDRLAFVKKFVDKEEDLSTFLDALLVAARGTNAEPVIFPLRLVSDQRGASGRLILEHLAVMI